MKSTTLASIAAIAVFATAGMRQLRAQEQQEHRGTAFPRYRVLDLGTLGDVGTSSSGFGINEKGWVAGSSNLVANGPQHAVLWRRDHIQDLGTLGGANSGASGVNARGEVALSSETASLDPTGEDFCESGTYHQCLGAIWKNGRLVALGTLAGSDQTGRPFGNSQAYGVNNKGEVVGFSENGQPDSCLDQGSHQLFQFEAVIWQPNGEIRKLQLPPEDKVAFAWGINDQGEAVGASGLCSNTAVPPNLFAPHAVLWKKDRTPIPLPGLGGAFTIATAINNRGDVVGGAESPMDGAGHILLWERDGAMRDLGTFPGAVVTVAPCCNTINNRRQIAGFWIDSSNNSHAFLWQDNRWKDLNGLIPKNSPWNLQAAESINDDGQITGSGTINGEVHAFLATPCHPDRDGRDCQENDR